MRFKYTEGGEEERNNAGTNEPKVRRCHSTEQLPRKRRALAPARTCCARREARAPQGEETIVRPPHNEALVRTSGQHIAHSSRTIAAAGEEAAVGSNERDTEAFA